MRAHLKTRVIGSGTARRVLATCSVGGQRSAPVCRRVVGWRAPRQYVLVGCVGIVFGSALGPLPAIPAGVAIFAIAVGS